MEYNFFYSHLISIPIIAFIISVIFKWITSKIKYWNYTISMALASWWMPSVHSAVVTSVTTAVALKYGIRSDLFWISFTFASLIIYDAINIRFEAGLHATAINKLIWEKFKEQLWHLPSEAFVWSLVWVFTAIVLFFVKF